MSVESLAAQGAAEVAPAATAPSANEVPSPPETDLVQLLSPDGDRVEHPDYSFDLGDDAILGFYRDLILTRRVDTEAIALQRQGELGIWASLLGQEAAQVGSGRAMRPQDYAFPTYREHGVALTRGVDPARLLGLFRGVDQGGWDSDKHGFHLYTIVIGAQTLHATGYAMGMQRDGAVGTEDGAAVIAYFGDGATSQGDVNEAFIFASVYDAPVVFFCQNNQWAISVPLERQTRIPLYQRARGFGFPGVRVDGNDVLASYAVTKAALDRAREGSGPTFVEAWTYRMGAHTTTDDPTRYRISSELDAWKLKDPILRVRSYLDKQGVLTPSFLADVEEEAEALAVRLRTEVRAMVDPSPLSVFDHVYVEETAILNRQRDTYAAYLESFESDAESSVGGSSSGLTGGGH